MARRNWMPRKISERAALLEHLDTLLIEYQDTLEITDDELGMVHRCNEMFKYVINVAERITTFSKAWFSYLKALNEGPKGISMITVPELGNLGTPPEIAQSDIFGYIRNLRGRLMLHKNYTEAIGLGLKFLGKERNFKKENYIPIIKIRVMGHLIKIITSTVDVNFHIIRYRIAGTTEWLEGKKFSGAKFIFDPPIISKNRAEVIEICIQGMIKNQLIGEPSVIIKAIIETKPIEKKRK